MTYGRYQLNGGQQPKYTSNDQLQRYQQTRSNSRGFKPGHRRSNSGPITTAKVCWQFYRYWLACGSDEATFGIGGCDWHCVVNNIRTLHSFVVNKLKIDNFCLKRLFKSATLSGLVGMVFRSAKHCRFPVCFYIIYEISEEKIQEYSVWGIGQKCECFVDYYVNFKGTRWLLKTADGLHWHSSTASRVRIKPLNFSKIFNA